MLSANAFSLEESKILLFCNRVNSLQYDKMLPAFFPFPIMFSKRLLLQGCQNSGFTGKELIHLSDNMLYQASCCIITDS